MWRSIILGVVAVSVSKVASAQPVSLAPPESLPQTPPMVVVAAQPQMQSNFGGGFIEFLFGDSAQQPQRGTQQWFGAPPQQRTYGNSSPIDPMQEQQKSDGRMDPRFLRQEVEYNGKEAPGTVVIDTPNHFLYLVQGDGKASAASVSHGQACTQSRARKNGRIPYLPHFVAGGPNNSLGARALYLGSTLYRIHGSNEPWTIGQKRIVRLHQDAQCRRHRPL
jgi:lipoprotein-anchoring transpeptidase ErfK/SrfK